MPRTTKKSKKKECPIHEGLRAIGGKWKPRVVCALAKGPMRFRDLREHIAEASAGPLTKTIKALHLDGILHREVFPESPPRVEYSLTDKGREAESILQSICQWRRRHMLEPQPAYATLPCCTACQHFAPPP